MHALNSILKIPCKEILLCEKDWDSIFQASEHWHVSRWELSDIRRKLVDNWCFWRRRKATYYGNGQDLNSSVIFCLLNIMNYLCATRMSVLESHSTHFLPNFGLSQAVESNCWTELNHQLIYLLLYMDIYMAMIWFSFHTSVR